MVKYVCKHCKFRCESKNLIECPYCGRESLEKERSAEELLDDVKDMLNN